MYRTMKLPVTFQQEAYRDVTAKYISNNLTIPDQCSRLILPGIYYILDGRKMGTLARNVERKYFLKILSRNVALGLI